MFLHGYLLFDIGGECMSDFYKDVGNRILLSRKLKGYSRETLAELANISPKFLYELETGKKGFSAFVLYNLCNALAVSSEYILTGETSINYDSNLFRVLTLYNQDQLQKITELLMLIYKINNI